MPVTYARVPSKAANFTANLDESQLRRALDELEYRVDIFKVTIIKLKEHLCVNVTRLNAVFKFFMFESESVSIIH
jgi:hypothetical protein